MSDERRWRLYRLAMTPPDSQTEVTMFAAPSAEDAAYLLDLYWSDGPRFDLCVWQDGDWQAVDAAAVKPAERGEYVTY